jgi:virginiamycin B lyase
MGTMTANTILSAGLVLTASMALGPNGAAQAPPARGVPQAALPEGDGRTQIQAMCAGCHPLTNITNSRGYSREGWDALTSSMIALPPEMKAPMMDYLGTHFPRKPGPTPAVIAGPASVDIREWVVPTLGSRPHDPLATRDGMIWWTGQWANVLGRLDPKTGAMKEFPLKTPKSGPHGLTEDDGGNIWYTGNSAGLVGKLDPRTGEVTEYKMPDPAARDPHTPVFDRNGMLWFSVQQSNMMGRLNPKTGDIKLITMPTPRSLPYGVVIDSMGRPFVVLFGTNKIARLDRETMAVHEYTLPNAASRPRRIAITSDDRIWYADYSRGFLGRLDPATGDVKEWASPSGPQSQPYGITVTGDIVWYNESGTRPNTLVRFDPPSEKFQTWTIPSGGVVVRNMMATREGNLVLACSGVNRVALVQIGTPRRALGPSAGRPVSALLSWARGRLTSPASKP